MATLFTGWTIRGSNPFSERLLSKTSVSALRSAKPPVQWVQGFFLPGSKAASACC